MGAISIIVSIPPNPDAGISKKQAVALGVAVAAILFIGVFAWFELLPQPAPRGWSQIHRGMNRATVLNFAGPPTHSGWPENVIETWERPGPIFRHRMQIGYDTEDGKGEHVNGISEGIWLRGFGWLNARKN